MEDPKIQLSSAERKMMENAEIILTKNRVLKKVQAQLEVVQSGQIGWVQQFGRADIFSVPPKISRGENYLGLPWLTLDYPRLSGDGNLFFIRSMFWWGRFYSSTLHLSGVYHQRAMHQVTSAYKVLGDYSIGINTDPWAHHFEASNYKRVIDLKPDAFALQVRTHPFLKIARTWPLQEWEAVEERMMKSWELLLMASGLVA